LAEEPVRAQGLQRGVAGGLDLEVFELAAFDGVFDILVVVDVFVFDCQLAVLQPDHERVALETQVAERAVHDGLQPHDFDWGLHLLLGREFVKLEFGVGVGELAVLEHSQELVVGDAHELLELLAQRDKYPPFSIHCNISLNVLNFFVIKIGPIAAKRTDTTRFISGTVILADLKYT
jgi:hypothetical protein